MTGEQLRIEIVAPTGSDGVAGRLTHRETPKRPEFRFLSIEQSRKRLRKHGWRLVYVFKPIWTSSIECQYTIGAVAIVSQ